MWLSNRSVACLLAAIGVITDSPVTVVGAMVLGPGFGPLAAVAVGLVLRRGDLVRRGALALAITSAKAASLVGVFISVTTVPAAAFAAVALLVRPARSGSGADR